MSPPSLNVHVPNKEHLEDSLVGCAFWLIPSLANNTCKDFRPLANFNATGVRAVLSLANNTCKDFRPLANFNATGVRAVLSLANNTCKDFRPLANFNATGVRAVLSWLRRRVEFERYTHLLARRHLVFCLAWAFSSASLSNFVSCDFGNVLATTSTVPGGLPCC
ncbi:hypothetical protein TrCOL_g1703 [Triparma columacea]|uniref:Uncharacterized protein n=1 Tax=Triparma columacea TaxID=722753 RepID=A0A9W7GMK3_9STRA|nr:hypothetical protein TrCOL_g1703 [Triparma columacea]